MRFTCRTMVLVILGAVLLAGIALATDAYDGAEALAEMICEDAGGVLWVDTHTWEELPGRYYVEVECQNGGRGWGSFYCPMCEPV